MSLLLGTIVDTLGGVLHGSPGLRIERLSTLANSTEGSMSFLANVRYLSQLAGCQATCVVVPPSAQDAATQRGACVVADDAYLYFARLTQLWRRTHGGTPPPGIHQSAVVDPSARVHPSATVGPHVVIERGAVVGAGSRVGARVFIGADCVIGERAILHAGVVIGADGFGFAPMDGQWEKIEQLGAVHIGHDVEIGANTCIDRGALDDTVIEDGVKLDNLIQIAHNVRIGRHTAMAACVGVAGSARIGAHCTVGGGAVILGHLTLADHVHVSAASVVTRSLLQPGTYTGIYPIDENARWEKNAASLRQLRQLRDRIRSLEAGLLPKDENS